MGSIDSKEKQKAGNYFKGLMKKAQEAINLVIGNSEVYSEEDTGGDLEFSPAMMMKINVTFDKEFLPKEKVVKLNVRGNRFFYDIKRNIREVNGLYIVYPPDYEIQFDVRRQEWEKRLIDELNDEYHLDLKKIHFVNEEEVCRRYQRKAITTIRRPYNLKKGELLIIAGGFANFNTEGEPLCTVKVNCSKESGEENKKTDRNAYEGNYFGKYSPKAGAYFYVGGEWYHNLFIPELYSPEESRFFYFRIADDGKNLKFFSDLKVRGLDIRSDVKTKTEPDCEKIIYTINPDYLSGTGVSDLKLMITYDTTGYEETAAPEVSGEVAQPLKDETEMSGEDVPTLLPARETREEKIQVQVRTYERKPGIPEKPGLPEPGKPGGPEEESLPYLESEMILLPRPKNDDISSYMMTIGDEKKSVQFYTNSIDDEVSILAPDREEKIYKRKISDRIDYSIKLDSIHYSISDIFLSQIDNKILKLYFAWELKTNVVERIWLKSDFYIFGREPLDDLSKQEDSTYEQLIRLNKRDDDFWRIGTSRDHGFLLKENIDDVPRHCLYNVSLSYPIYLLKTKNLENSLVRPSILDPVPGEEKLAAFLANIKKALANNLTDQLEVSTLAKNLKEFANWAVLENNDLVIIGNRVFKYIVPVVMESPLSANIQKSILRKIQLSESVLRK
ncbi:MAG: hypothetical protein JSV88_19050 [Candidatus Aminicenantes bacterium]|nr:MAG: hypothetical protein JSV88_19050 [Candidatus Aminicenantes bacterium]